MTDAPEHAQAWGQVVQGLGKACALDEKTKALAYLAVFSTVVAFLCYNYALTQFPAARAALFINGIPVVTAIGAWALLGEVLTPIQVLGGALVLGAVFFSSFAESRQARLELI